MSGDKERSSDPPVLRPWLEGPWARVGFVRAAWLPGELGNEVPAAGSCWEGRRGFFLSPSSQFLSSWHLAAGCLHAAWM